MAPTTGWIGFGLASKLNSMANSDIVMTGVRANGEAYIVVSKAGISDIPIFIELMLVYSNRILSPSEMGLQPEIGVKTSSYCRTHRQQNTQL